MTDMMSISLKTHQVALWGRVAIGCKVLDERGNVVDEEESIVPPDPVQQARVEIIEFPEAFQRRLYLKSLIHGQKWESLSNRPDRTLTTIDGSFYFMDLPEGSYRVRAIMVRESSSQKKNQCIEKSLSIVGNKPNRIELILPLTTSGIVGQVTDKEKGSPVADAQVKFKDSKEETLCDRDGKFQLLNLHAPEAPSTRSVQLEISASGYKEFTTDPINLSQGVVHRIKPIQLTKTNPT